MTQQIDIYGVFLPTLGIAALITFFVFSLITRLLARTGFYGWVWHRPLFDAAFYFALLGLAGLFLKWCYI
ncbi:DUF1656 domain-containing protein [Thioclava sp. BHET1]|nr:DUF1656 domain-containing protein [Thioclava sp. BHET1]